MNSAYLQPDPGICELVRVIFTRSENKAHITKTRIMKILFLVRDKLSDDNPLKNRLAFYWYRRGPYSMVIADNLDYMQGRSWIILDSDGTYAFSTEYLRKKIISYNEPIREATDIAASIVQNHNQISETIDRVYGNAPYSWYRDYEKFQDGFERYCNHILDKEGATNRFTGQDIIRLFRRTIVTVPDEAEFKKFSLIYNAFSRMLMPLLEAENPYEYKNAYDRLCLVSEEIWNVFASIVRLVHHDPYYDRHVPSWRQDCQDRLLKLDQNIRNAEDTLDIPELIEEFDEETLRKINAPINPDNVYTPAELLREIDEIRNSQSPTNL